MYRLAGPVLVRAAARPNSRIPAWWPDLADSGPRAAEVWRRWLAEVMESDGDLAVPDAGGEPELLRRARSVAAGAEIGAAQLRRLVSAVMAHVLVGTRATPTGLSGGVSVARTGDVPVAPVWGEGRVVARVDARWLVAVLERLEPATGESLPVTGNRARWRRGGKVFLADHETGTEVAVDATDAVLTALRAADGGPVALGDVMGRVVLDHPHFSVPSARKLVRDLLHAGLVISALRPPTTALDPLGHLLAAAAKTGADLETAARPLLAEVRHVRQELMTHNRLAGAEERRTVRAGLACWAAERSERFGGAPPVAVDLRLDAGPMVLPDGLAPMLTDAAEALVRLSPHPGGHPVWTAYRTRFLRAYGAGAVVPLPELVSPNSGIGLPGGYRGSLLPVPAAAFGARDELLLSLAQQAAVEGLEEVEVDGALLRRLGPGPVGAVPAHVELTVRLLADGRGADGGPGRYGVAVEAQPRPGGTTATRFLPLLDDGDRKELTAALRGAPAARHGARAVQVSAPTLTGRAANLTRTPALLPVLPLGECPESSAGAVRLEDIGVCADERRMWLVNLANGSPLEARLLSPLWPRSATGPLARFLTEIGTAFTSWPAAFHWGAASNLPFLPRLVRGPVVLSPARWTLPATALPATELPWEQWRTATVAWLDRYRVPDRVYLVQHGRRLPLDRTVPEHLVLLHEHLEREPAAVLVEAPAADADGWCGRAVELTVQLHSTRPPLPTAPRPARTTGFLDWQLPGASGVLSARLHGNPQRADEILSQVGELTKKWVNPPSWWFKRGGEGTNLRLVLLLPEAGAWPLAAERVGQWAQDLRERGLLTHTGYDTHQPQAGRFGRGAALRAAEQVFAADTRAVLAQLAYQRGDSAEPLAVTAVSMLRLAIGLLGPDAGSAWLRERRRHSYSRVSLSPRLTRTAAELAGPDDVLADTTEGRALAQAWQQRDDALAEYRDALLRAPDGLEPHNVLPALLNAHVNRAGLLNQAADVSRALAGHCAHQTAAATDGGAR
ncbi:lantibiotic dehydratase [Kitasatospora saccharophila]|uniref:lantibiotic dehydratase n=1 Tax=Kitasatospora saccharophila TaxID=407973 RepID=UPI0031D9987C